MHTIATKKGLVQNQIDMKMLLSNHHMNLPADECEATAHLQKELNYGVLVKLWYISFSQLYLLFVMTRMPHCIHLFPVFALANLVYNVLKILMRYVDIRLSSNLF